MSNKFTIDYMTRDYRGYKEFMKEVLSKQIPEWTDHSDSDMGIAIIDSLSYGLDILSYYQEKSLREAVLATAKTKIGVLNGASFLGYKPEGQKPSKGVLTVTKKEDYLNTECIIPITSSKFGKEVVFEATETVVIPAGEMSAEVPIVQGLTEEGEIVGTSTGNVYQSFTLNHEDVIAESIYLEVIRNGFPEEWKLVDSLLYSRGDSKEFTLSLNEENQTVVEFGDGILGAIPPDDSVIRVSYRHGGGHIGNLEKGMIREVSDLSESSLEFIDTVINEEATFGGRDFESIEQIKDKAPKLFRIHNRIVSAVDAKEFAETFPGVIKASYLETFRNDFYVYLHLNKEYRGNSENLREELKEKMDEIRIKNTRLHIEEASVKEFDIKVIVYVGRDIDTEITEESVKSEIEEYFKDGYFEFKQPFYATKVLDLSYNIRGVRNAVLGEGVTDIIPEAEEEILTLGNVEVEVKVLE